MSAPAPRRSRRARHPRRCLASRARFFLGAPEPSWLWDGSARYPLFVSHRRLARYKRLRPATVDWALDSGGFTELSTYGEWRTTPEEYVLAVARYQREIGRLKWAAPQDHMCEPVIINGGRVGRKIIPGTHLSVIEHQRLTVANFLELRQLWAELVPGQPCPFIPVLQGWELADYLRCAAMYKSAGVDLAAFPVVGVGSVCRRQATSEIAEIMTALLKIAPRLHGFGVKTSGLSLYGHLLTSADSMAWSYDARRSDPLPGCTHRTCASCRHYATTWRRKVIARLAACHRRPRVTTVARCYGPRPARSAEPSVRCPAPRKDRQRGRCDRAPPGTPVKITFATPGGGGMSQPIHESEIAAARAEHDAGDLLGKDGREFQRRLEISLERDPQFRQWADQKHRERWGTERQRPDTEMEV
jgi:hypothetical protein